MDQYALRSYKYWTTKASDLRDWGEQTAPVVAKKAAELNTAAQPYVKQAKEQLWKAYQWCGQTTWWAVQKVGQSVPFDSLRAFPS